MGKLLARTLLYAALLFVAALTLIPLIWLVACSFKNNADFFAYTFFPPPSRLTLEKFVGGPDVAGLFDQMPFLRLMMNSLFVAGSTVMVQLVVSSLGVFALAKYEFRG